MKTTKLHTKIVSGIAMLLLSVTALHAQDITITSPTSETVWKGGESCTITWTHTGNAPSVFNIKLVLGNVIITDLDDNAGIDVPTAAGSYTFKLTSKERDAGKVYSICFETADEMQLGCSPSFAIQKGQPTGVAERDVVQDFCVYPVPAGSTSVLSFLLKESGPLQVSVYDMLGHEVVCLKNEDVNAGRQEVAFGLDLQHGIYLVQLKTRGGVVSRRVVFND